MSSPDGGAAARDTKKWLGYGGRWRGKAVGRVHRRGKFGGGFVAIFVIGKALAPTSARIASDRSIQGKCFVCSFSRLHAEPSRAAAECVIISSIT